MFELYVASVAQEVRSKVLLFFFITVVDFFLLRLIIHLI
jgi:hypothetical protein